MKKSSRDMLYILLALLVLIAIVYYYKTHKSKENCCGRF